ncbi:MAG: hypothetical protein VR72_19390 [Clostridiaceae bacterium BRH_c20a]|nr:MAG: hypothetical protein VR72_19390 [Clostridiaceae bacterium BRH_c20a]
MKKVFQDKIIALLGAGLLGYYLGLSLFRGIIRDCLLKILPPINNRHLPDMYFGIIGAVVAILLTYLLFNLVVEKKSFKIHQKSYLAVISLLIIVPLMIVGIFRMHAVSLVTKAESTIPTEITIRSNSTGNSLMFKTSSSSAGGVVKSIEVPEQYLADFGKLIRELGLKEVVSGKEQKFDQPYLTMWINYRRTDGKWYSKILSYDQGLFEEWVAGERLAYYKNNELEELLEKLLVDSKNINNYDQARIFNSMTMNERTEKNILAPKDFQVLVNSLKPENVVQQDTEGVARIKAALEDWVPEEETNIYAIELLQKNSPKKVGQNFMAYDQLTHTLMFEGKYYKVDLTKIVEK